VIRGDDGVLIDREKPFSTIGLSVPKPIVEAAGNAGVAGVAHHGDAKG
jgi:hypothetical protein